MKESVLSVKYLKIRESPGPFQDRELYTFKHLVDRIIQTLFSIFRR